MKIDKKNIFCWALRLVAAVIMSQTLFYKFTAAPEPVYIFTKLGMEPWGRMGIGVMELVSSLLIIIPRTTVYGAIIGVGLMGGAIYFHLTKLGIVVLDDSGQLFIYSLLVFISCSILAYIYRSQVLDLFFKTKKAAL